MEEKTIRIRILRHDKTDLLMAVSEDLPGLVVHGHTVDEIEKRLPSVARDLLEVRGHRVESIELVRDKALTFKDYGPPAFLANVHLTSAAA